MIGKLAVVLLAVVALADDCEAKQPKDQDGRAKACDTRLAAPTVEVLGPKVTIAAEARTDCDIVLTEHRVTIWFERYGSKSGQWETIGPKPIDANNFDPLMTCPGLPHPGETLVCKVRIFRCETGAWRTRGMVAYRDMDNRQKLFTIPEAPSATVLKCPKPAA